MIDGNGEAWDAWAWSQYVYPKKHPQAKKPDCPPDLICLHGIAIRGGGIHEFRNANKSVRLDYRGDQKISLSRHALSDYIKIEEEGDQIESRWEEILTKHLNSSNHAKSEDGWRYKQRLIKDFPMRVFWDSVPGTIKVYKNGMPHLMSLNEIRQAQIVTTIISGSSRFPRVANPLGQESDECSPNFDNDAATIIDLDFPSWSENHREDFFGRRSPMNIRCLQSGHLAVDWRCCETRESLIHDDRMFPMWLAKLPAKDTVAISILRASYSPLSIIILNSSNDFVQRLERIRLASLESQFGLKTEQYERIISLLESPAK